MVSNGATRSDVVERHKAALHALEDELENALGDFEKLVDFIDRDEDAPEEHFFGAVFGLRMSSMFFKKAALQTYGKRQVAALQSATRLSIHINSMLAGHPDAASEIGREMLSDLQKSSERINALVRAPATNREIIQECKYVLTQTKAAIGSLLGRPIGRN
jgi:predicted translin family RNA/ssDNA-binding protein